jgi:hypothetical protein
MFFSSFSFFSPIYAEFVVDVTVMNSHSLRFDRLTSSIHLSIRQTAPLYSSRRHCLVDCFHTLSIYLETLVYCLCRQFFRSMNAMCHCIVPFPRFDCRLHARIVLLIIFTTLSPIETIFSISIAIVILYVEHAPLPLSLPFSAQ